MFKIQKISIFHSLFKEPKIMITPEIISIGKIKKPKNIELLSIIKVAINASMNIKIIHILNIFCIQYFAAN